MARALLLKNGEDFLPMKKNNFRIFLVLILGFHAFTQVYAQTDDSAELDKLSQEKPSKNVRSRPQVLDFEAEVIEGERKTPNLFLQLEIDSPSLDSVMYKRRNFNDFHLVEVDRKPLYKRPDK